MTNAVEVRNVSKLFKLHHERNQSLKSAIMRGRISRYEEFTAVNDVTFDVKAGSTFGLIGSNGSGKSTLLKCLARIYSPNKGSITYNGRMAALLEVGSGFHHELSGKENIYLNGSILGMSKKEIDSKYDEIVDFSGVEQFIDQPIKNYSSGMYVRLGFSVAISVEPDILVADEVLAVGDEAFQRKCLDKFKDFKMSGRTVILVSHSMESIKDMCDQAAWLEKGNLQVVGESKDVVSQYLKSLG
ncbi:lipopolysaccharide transport system ATP-binding protein [Aurantimicrobium minutum]|jgi:ABC-2 type transport system ATP-binding protein|uniref:ABC transporter ATP-binding protein n=1 Tax=Aurantimicrobium minutum TaxID=708131 RepID=UPI002474C193|nr:ABC transporter ATP-binding protein [Aurantimicrobium minutum]MDH6278218.1 lipopolysaccharide transport system ATP-binding protein [Aurantimicrobium minutum]